MFILGISAIVFFLGTQLSRPRGYQQTLQPLPTNNFITIVRLIHFLTQGCGKLWSVSLGGKPQNLKDILHERRASRIFSGQTKNKAWLKMEGPFPAPDTLIDGIHTDISVF